MSNIEEDDKWFQQQLGILEDVGGQRDDGDDDELEEEVSLESKLEMLKKNGYSLQNLDESLKSCFEVIIEALRRDETQFRYLSDDIKNNRNFILGLCREEILKSLFVLNEKFQGDLEIVLELVKISPNNFLAASKELKNCGIFVKLLMENYNLRLRLVGGELRKNQEFLLWSAKCLMERKVFKMAHFLKSINPEVLQSEDFIFGLVSLDPKLITFFDSVKRNEEFIAKVAQSCEDTAILEHVDRDIRDTVMAKLGIEKLEPVEEIISEESTSTVAISLTMPSDEEEEEDDPEKMNEFFQNVLAEEEEEEEEENPQKMADFFQNVLDDLNE